VSDAPMAKLKALSKFLLVHALGCPAPSTVLRVAYLMRLLPLHVFYAALCFVYACSSVAECSSRVLANAHIRLVHTC